MKTTNVLLGIIAASLALPQLPALRKVIHNNTIYPVQKALYGRAWRKHKEELIAWCKDSSSVWVQRTSDEKYRRAQYFERTKAPVRGNYKSGWFGDTQFFNANRVYNEKAPKGKTYSVDKCIKAMTEPYQDMSDYRRGAPKFKAKRPEPID
tara:strand:- start:1136 stop:1588 length:453 start_codon:yes stop_codon:yes gene_type:complete